MLLRVCLILAIVAGAGVIALSQFKVKPHIQAIIAEREHNFSEWKREEGERKKAQTQLADTRSKLESTEQKLEETTTALTAATARANAQQQRADTLQTNLDQTKATLNEAQQEVARWRATGTTPDQVVALVASVKSLRTANEALEEENKVVAKELKKTQAQLDIYIKGDPDYAPPLPAGLKGKILVVDPRYDFVVLDIGEKQGVLEKGVMMVSRGSTLVGKVKIMSVQADRSIANILPNWKLSDIMEGDQVLY